MFSIYCTLYNLSAGFIDWKKALDNFCSFAEEVVISTTTRSDDDTVELLKWYKYAHNKENLKIIVTDFSLNDPFFDGKLKNSALKECKEPFCILLDGDERIDLKDKDKWINYSNLLRQSSLDAFFIPVIDLFNSDKEYKSIGVKWYLHKNLPHLHRGVVDFAKKDNNTIDHNKSDTCELLSFDDRLCNASSIITDLNLYNVKSCIPKIWHLGWLDKQKRLKSNAFWQPIWDKRAGKEVKNIIHSEDELNKIEYFKHGLLLWYE